MLFMITPQGGAGSRHTEFSMQGPISIRMCLSTLDSFTGLLNLSSIVVMYNYFVSLNITLFSSIMAVIIAV